MERPLSLEQLQEYAPQIRRDILRMTHAVNSGHPGGSLGCVEYFLALFGHFMQYDPTNFSVEDTGEDLFFLSNGHITPVYYSILCRFGYFPTDELHTFRKLDSRLQGHPTTHEGLPGVRVATGSLGQGLSVSIGAALAKKLNNDPHTVYTLTGDGELQEGQIWEAANFAAHHKVDNLIVTVDLNYKQIDGDTRDVMNTMPLREKFEAFGWQVLEIDNGNDQQQVIDGIYAAREHLGQGKPIIILMTTEMGSGIDYMAGTHAYHGVAPNDDELERGLAQQPETLGDY